MQILVLYHCLKHGRPKTAVVPHSYFRMDYGN